MSNLETGRASVHLVWNDGSAGDGGRPVAWALGELSATLTHAGVPCTTAATPTDTASLTVQVLSPEEAEGQIGGAEPPAAAESYLVARDGERITVVGADASGTVHALLELAARVAHAEDPLAALTATGVESGAPAVPVRGIVRSFSSVDEDLPWFHDRDFWTEYLTWIAAARFSRFHLALGMQYNYGADQHGATDNYLCFAYPFLLDVDGFEVRAEGVDAAERDRNLETLRFVAAETKRRGMRFQLGLWNHAYDYGRDSVHRYPIVGIGPDNHADYCRAAIAQLLRAVPDIDGLTFRVHYEGGIHDENHEVFWSAVFEGADSVGRPLEIDMHAKGVDQALLDAVDRPMLSPVLSAKYWAEHLGLPYHQASIRAREAAKPIPAGHEMKGITEFSRRFTRYGYGDFLREDREVDLMFRVWPGTQKLLLWGDPAIAAGYGRLATFGGSRGVDVCEPLFFKGRKGSGEPGKRDPYVDPELQLGGHEWTKYRYTYLLWGRLLFDPESDPEVWRRHLRAGYGPAAGDVETALSALSRILPLVTVVHGVGGSNNGYWPEVYVNLAISSRVPATHYASDTDDPKNWGGVSPFDPTTFYGVDEYVADAARGAVSGKYTPLEVAGWIEDLVTEGRKALDGARATADPSDAQVRRTLIDLEVLVRMGTFFAGKFRTAVDYSTFRYTEDPRHLESALTHYRPARDAYASILDVVDGVYQADLRFGVERSEHGHWADRLPEIDADLAALEQELAEAAPDVERADLPQVPPRPVQPGVEHVQPPRFQRGAPLTLALDVLAPDSVAGATLHYRHVDQSESFRAAVMQPSDGGLRGTIDADYTASPYPLMYFFDVEHRNGGRTMVPGLAPDLTNQPYFTLGSAGEAR
ncbi:hypothetical protein ACQEVB_23545 [Pseudonocardia sp. CA-107938]|uniref:hypothetical protein n=1 Tax=Pseudonocardia sp. CA-107938 TaxID=3240021 RepID=UPI003D8D4CB0